MGSERDDLFLDGLHGAWRGVSPPPVADGVEESDAGTRVVVDWMRAAFDALEVPPVPAYGVPRRRRVRSLPMPLAAAASALVAAGLWLWMHSGPAPVPPGGPPELAGRHEPGPSNPGAGHVAAPDGPVIAALGPDRIELRSGPVRLVLLQPADGRKPE